MTRSWPVAWDVAPPQPGDPEHAQYLAARSADGERLRALVEATEPPRLAALDDVPMPDVPEEEQRKLAARMVDGLAESDDKPKVSQATRLLELAEDADLFHAPNGDPYAVLDLIDHRETWPVRSGGFRDWLRHAYYRDRKASPSAQAMTDALGVLEARARFEGATIPVSVRIAEHEGSIYLDLADDAWQVVEVTSTGWHVVSDPPVRFRRPGGLLALPEPVPGGSLERLWEGHYVNVTDERTRRLLIAFLLASASPSGPYPLLLLTGEQGSAKSTAARVIRSIIDPSESPLRAEPREVRDLLIAARNGWIVALDNLSGMPGWLSDALCRLSTGGGFATRMLYSDSDEIILDAQRPTIITGISDVAVRGDLLDRAITVELPRIPDQERRLERDLWAAFEQDRPAILGALLDAVAGALARRDDVHLARPPRMADFATWVTAAEPALGWTDGAFLEAYAENRATAHELALDGSAVAGGIRELLPESGGSWEGTAAELLEALAVTVGRDDVERLQKRKEWPASPRGLAGDLRRLAPNLRAVGIEVSFVRDTSSSRRRTWTITREGPESTVRTVRPSDLSTKSPDDGPDGRTQTRTVGTVPMPSTEHASDGPDGPDGRIPTPSNGLWDPEMATDDDAEMAS